jgi:hypothetical protein
MLISFGRYRFSYAVSLFLSISVLGALLMAGFIGKDGYGQADLTFAMATIVCGVTYATVRDAAGGFAYALESSKFYRDEADFALLKSYDSGCRRIGVLLVRPIASSLLIAALFVGLQFVIIPLLPATSGPNLLASTFLVALIFPVVLSSLVYFLSPVFVGWKELEARKIKQGPEAPGSTVRLIHRIAVADLVITMLINVALVMPVRHSPDFAPSLGYGSAAFVVAALILAMVVVTLSLLSSWRTRLQPCSGDLYRARDIAGPQVEAPRVSGNRWVRWARYSLLMCAFTLGACLLLGTLYETAPIELVLGLLLLPVALMFWVERTALLATNFRDASQLVAEFPARMSGPERVELARSP